MRPPSTRTLTPSTTVRPGSAEWPDAETPAVGSEDPAAAQGLPLPLEAQADSRRDPRCSPGWRCSPKVPPGRSLASRRPGPVAAVSAVFPAGRTRGSGSQGLESQGSPIAHKNSLALEFRVPETLATGPGPEKCHTVIRGHKSPADLQATVCKGFLSNRNQTLVEWEADHLDSCLGRPAPFPPRLVTGRSPRVMTRTGRPTPSDGAKPWYNGHFGVTA